MNWLTSPLFQNSTCAANKFNIALMVLETMKKYKFTHLLIFSQFNKDAEKIINVGTTLVLEASLLNENVYQLKINSPNYGSFARACENYHIAKYLNSYSEIIDLTCGEEGSKIEAMMKEEKGSNHYAAQIKKWLFNEEIETSINKIVKEISK